MLCVYHSLKLNMLIRIENCVLTAIDFVEPLNTGSKSKNHLDPDIGDAALVTEIYRQLDDYQNGKRRSFELPYVLEGTSFQKQVWEALLTIPYGETVSYSKVAERIGKPLSVRAVANAIGSNPLPVIIPCHRVIGKNGSLRGFGGGLALKQYLIGLETGSIQ